MKAIWSSALVVAFFAGAAASASAAPFSTLYSFGDSLSDVGNAAIATGGAIPESPPYAPGRFSNGPVWVEDLSRSLGLGAVTPSLAGGNDYAVGGAETGTTAVNTAGPGDLPSQLASYAATHAVAPQPSALYTLWIGSNDLLSVLGSANPAGNAATVIPQAVFNVVSFVSSLAVLGAEHLLVLTVPDLGLTPAIKDLGNPALDALATTISADFDAALESSLSALAATDGLDLKFLDTFGLLDAAVADPAAYGIANASTPCWTGSPVGTGPGTLCSSDPAVQDSYLFWDPLHPTETGQAFVAAAAYQLLVPEPASLVLLAGAFVVLWSLRPAAPALSRRRLGAGRDESA